MLRDSYIHGYIEVVKNVVIQRTVERAEECREEVDAICCSGQKSPCYKTLGVFWFFDFVIAKRRDIYRR